MSCENRGSRRWVFPFLFFLTLFCGASHPRPGWAASKPQPQPEKIRSLFAYVFDERFSVVRARPHAAAFAMRRLRMGHRIFLIQDKSIPPGSKYRRIVVSRNLGGWILAAAIAAPGVAGDDEKLFKFALTQPADQSLIALKLLTQHFTHSSMLPNALLQLGAQAETMARHLSVRANRKLSREELDLPAGLGESDLFANYRGLDHFESFGIKFVYHTKSDRYFYRGDAYEALLRIFPRAPQSIEARERIEKIREQLQAP